MKYINQAYFIIKGIPYYVFYILYFTCNYLIYIFRLGTKFSRNFPNINYTSQPPQNNVKFYMQGHCRYGKKGLGCSYPHPPMCFKFIKSGYKGCPKGDSCKYAHPKISRSSLLSHKCDQVKCYFYHGMLQAQLGPTLIKTYTEILCQKDQFLIQLP